MFFYLFDYNARFILEAKVKYSTFYVINIVFQSIFTLLWQIGASIFLGWIFVRFVNAPPWIYVPLILVGVVSGLVSMVRFILAAMQSLDRIEEQRRAKNKKINSKESNNG